MDRYSTRTGIFKFNYNSILNSNDEFDRLRHYLSGQKPIQ